MIGGIGSLKRSGKTVDASKRKKTTGLEPEDLHPKIISQTSTFWCQQLVFVDNMATREEFLGMPSNTRQVAA